MGYPTGRKLPHSTGPEAAADSAIELCSLDSKRKHDRALLPSSIVACNSCVATKACCMRNVPWAVMESIKWTQQRRRHTFLPTAVDPMKISLSTPDWTRASPVGPNLPRQQHTQCAPTQGKIEVHVWKWRSVSSSP